MKNERGVTLLALVLSIIVLLILATIAVYSGTGTVRYTKFSKARAEIQILSAQVNKWNEEYINGNEEVLSYGNGLSENSEEANEAIAITFDSVGITDESQKNKYRFFSEQFLKNEIGIDTSFDYLINIEDRDVLLVAGVYYNKRRYFSLKDFGVINIESNLPDEISFEVEQGTNKEIVLYDVKLKNSSETDGNDISKFNVQYKKLGEENWKDATKDVVKFEDGEGSNKVTKFKFSVGEYGQYDVKINTTDRKYEHQSERLTVEPRHGIKVGDYITYVSPTESVSLSTIETGYSSEQELPAKNDFRVMDIDSNGNMTLMGAMTSSDKIIYFNGALGYNNAVYTLNTKCSDLYKDTSKGITARSIKVEDITDKFNDIGNGKLTTYINGQVGTETEDGILTTGTYITNIDKKNKTITYQTRTNCPDIFQYEKGGIINETTTSGEIGQSDSYLGYEGLTTITNIIPTPTNLTVPFTYYNTHHTSEDFKDSSKASVYQNIFFSNSYYFLASRCIFCDATVASFRLRIVEGYNIRAGILYSTNNISESGYARICPIVYLPDSVEVQVSKNPKNQSNTSGTAHVVK